MQYQRATRRNGDGEEREVIVRRVKRDEEVVCYGDVGCFRDEGPFDYLDMLPSPPEEVGTKILLYTRDAAIGICKNRKLQVELYVLVQK